MQAGIDTEYHTLASEPEQEKVAVTPPVVLVLAEATAPPNGVVQVPVPAVAPDSKKAAQLVERHPNIFPDEDW